MTATAAAPTSPSSAHPAIPGITGDAPGSDAYRSAPDTYSFSDLTSQDVGRICAYLRIPTPTPDVGLPECARVAGYPDAHSVARALRSATDPLLMIAAAALRGVRRLPPDPQLRPQPHARLRHAPPRDPRVQSRRAALLAPHQTRAEALLPPDDHVVTEHAPMSHWRAGTASAERRRCYAVGKTLAQLLAEGITRADLVWDVQRSAIKFEPAPTSDARPEDRQ